MKRVFILTLFACFAFVGCEKPCEPGFKKSGLKCKMIPIRDGGFIGADGGATRQGPNGMDAAFDNTDSRMDGSPAPEAGKEPAGGRSDSGPMADASQPFERIIEDGGTPPTTSETSAQIAQVRAAIRGTAAWGPLPVGGAIVSFVKKAFANQPVGLVDGPSVFVQNGSAGPALLLAMDPATLVPGGVRVGDRLDLTVTAGKVADDAVLVTAATARLIGEKAELPAAQEVSGLALSGFPPGDFELESELISIEATVAGPFATSGSGFSAAQITTTGVPDASAYFVLRAPKEWIADKRIVKGCVVSASGVPLLQRLRKVQVTAWESEDADVKCPPFDVLKVYPAAQVDVPIRAPIRITFNQPVAKADITTQIIAGPCTGAVQLSSDDFQTCLPFKAGSAELDMSATVATMFPKEPLDLYRGYYIRVVAGTSAASGAPLSLTKRFGFTTTAEAATCTAPVIISQIYGGGGNVGAPLNRDFIELHNRGAAPISLVGWSLQWGDLSNWHVSPLPDVSIPGGGYYLVAQGDVGVAGIALEQVDAEGKLKQGATAGRCALASTTEILGSTAEGALPAHMEDLVAYGTSPAEGTPVAALTNTTAALRTGNGCDDSNNNAADFSVDAPAPRSSKTTPYVCPCSAP